jgi:hypothetical protein
LGQSSAQERYRNYFSGGAHSDRIWIIAVRAELETGRFAKALEIEEWLAELSDYR